MRAALLLLGLAACDAATSDPGLGAPLYVGSAQFRPGAFPAATGGPATVDLKPLFSTMIIGEYRQKLTGHLAPDATAAIIGLQGAPGAWIVPAGAPDVDAPTDATLSATLGINEATPGPVSLVVAAVDTQGKIGEPMTADVVALDAPAPDGVLVVSLQWVGRADLDLHVVDPLGGEAWSGNPDTYQKPPPGTPVDPTAYLTGGLLDHDGNAGCTLDGEPSEDVVWAQRKSTSGTTVDPIVPPGEYTVRVDARSLCGDASAAWAVTVYSQGAVLGAARGIATPDDVTYEPHGAGAGITALHFTL
jgi:hypothetical protein